MNQDHQKLQKNYECDYKTQEQNFLGFTLNGKFVTVVVVNFASGCSNFVILMPMEGSHSSKNLSRWKIKEKERR